MFTKRTWRTYCFGWGMSLDNPRYVGWFFILSTLGLGCSAGPDGDAFGAASDGVNGAETASTTEASRASVVQGASTDISVVLRRGTRAAPLRVTLEGLPEGLASTTATVSGEETTVTIKVTASVTSQTGSTKAMVVAVDSESNEKVSADILIDVRGRPGTVDRTFGRDGSAELDPYVGSIGFDDKGNYIVLSSPKGACRLNRYLPDGSLDMSFATMGPSVPCSAMHATQHDGKILVAHPVPRADGKNSDAKIVVERYLPTGAADETFGTVVVPFVGLADFGDDNRHYLASLTVQPDDKILIGASFLVAGSHNAELARLTVDGKPDSSFGTDGLAFLNPIPPGQPETLLFQPDGKIVALGFDARFRVLPDGTLDSAYARSGLAPPLFAFKSDAALLPSGDVLLVGSNAFDSDRKGLGRYTNLGDPDATYGSEGMLKTSNLPWPTKPTDVEKLDVLKDGSVLIAGSDVVLDPAGRSSSGRLLIGKSSAAGALDNAFGEDGQYIRDLLPGPPHVNALLDDGMGHTTIAYSYATIAWAGSGKLGEFPGVLTRLWGVAAAVSPSPVSLDARSVTGAEVGVEQDPEVEPGPTGPTKPHPQTRNAGPATAKASASCSMAVPRAAGGGLEALAALGLLLARSRKRRDT